MRLRRTFALSTVILAICLLAPGLAPTVEATSRSRELAQLVEVVHTEEAEPTYVAAVVRNFGASIEANVRVIRVDDGPTLLETIRASRASILIVAAHGSSDFAGPDSGLLVRGERVTHDALVAAVEQSAARRFFFAACGLDLPEEVDGRAVRSFPTPIDMKLAAVEALSDVGLIYTVPTQEHFLPQFTMAIQSVASIGELFVRYIDPIDPLRPDDGAGYECYAGEYGQCAWDRIEEERVQESAQREGGGFAAPAPILTEEMQALVDAGLLKMVGNGAAEYGQTWRFLLTFDFDCMILFDVMDLVVPGYSRALDHLPDVKGVRFDLSILRVELCGKLFVGMLLSGGGAGGGQLKLQIGSTKEVEFKFGWVTASFSFYIGVIFEATGLVEDASGGTMEYIRLNFQLSVYLLIEGSWGWGTGTTRFDFLNPPFQRGETFRNPFAGGGPAANVQIQPPPFSTIPDSTGLPRIESTTDYMVLPLSEPALRALERNPEFAARLSEATGVDITKVAPGTMLNLGNSEVHRAIYGDAFAGRSATTLIKDPIVGPAALAPLVLDGCNARFDAPEPFGGAAAQACADVSANEVNLAGGASASGADIDSFLMQDPTLAPWWNQTYGVGTMRICGDVQDRRSYLCQSLATAAAAHSIWKSRADEGLKASIRIRADVDNAAAFVDLCADLFANPVCVPGSAGAIGPFENFHSYDSVVGPGGSVDDRVATALRSTGPDTAAGDTRCLVAALDPSGADLC